MKTIFQNIIFLIFGFVIGYFVGCGQKVNVITKDKIITKIDTVSYVEQVKVPFPVIETIILHDTIEKQRIDSILTEIVHVINETDTIPVNSYQDSVQTQDYKLKYDIKTIGLLQSFDYKLDVYKKSETLTKYQKTKWTVGAGISNRLNYKLGFGYKGWMLEGVLGKDYREFYVGKQFSF